MIRTKFLEKYFPNYMRRGKKNIIYALKTKSVSVGEYASKF